MISLVHIIPNLKMGGSERCVVNLCRYLGKPFRQRVISLYNEIDPSFSQALKSTSTDIEFLGKQAGWDTRLPSKISELISQWKPHIITTHQYTLLYCLSLMNPRHPWVSSHRLATYPHASWEQRELFPLWWFSRRGTAVISVSQEITERLHRFRFKNISTIPNGIDLTSYPSTPQATPIRQTLGLSESDLLVMSVANFYPVKQHALLLKSFAKVLTQHPHCHLILIGQGPLENFLRQLACQLQISKHVHFMGYRQDIPQVLTEANIYVMCSAREGSSHALAEAMACGVPVIASSVSGVKHLISSNQSGLILVQTTQPQLSQALKQLIEDENKRKKMGQMGKQVIQEKGNLSRMISNYHTFYLSLIKNSRSPQ